MRKAEVLTDCLLSVKAGSIVIVDDRQFEVARRILKPVENKAKEESVIETAEKPKRKKKKEEE